LHNFFIFRVFRVFRGWSFSFVKHLKEIANRIVTQQLTAQQAKHTVIAFLIFTGVVTEEPKIRQSPKWGHCKILFSAYDFKTNGHPHRPKDSS
jgi:hypothetical protein